MFMYLCVEKKHLIIERYHNYIAGLIKETTFFIDNNISVFCILYHYCTKSAAKSPSNFLLIGRWLPNTKKRRDTADPLKELILLYHMWLIVLYHIRLVLQKRFYCILQGWSFRVYCTIPHNIIAGPWKENLLSHMLVLQRKFSAPYHL